MATTSPMNGSVMSAPSQPIAEHGIGPHQGKAAEAENEKDEIEHVRLLLRADTGCTMLGTRIKSRLGNWVAVIRGA